MNGAQLREGALSGEGTQFTSEAKFKVGQNPELGPRSEAGRKAKVP
jgi:hypothetical protein